MSKRIKPSKQHKLTFGDVLHILFGPLLDKDYKTRAKSRPSSYPVLGRSSEINLPKYQTKVLGRDVIDYDRLKRDDPDLYKKIVDHEREFDRNIDNDLE